MIDYYATLGVSPDASLEAVKRAWRRAAREAHPDLPVNRDVPEAKERFRRIREAYDVLSDEQRRAAYDRKLERARGGHERWQESWHDAPGARVQDAEDIVLDTETGQGVEGIFADLFGEPAPKPPQGRGPASVWDPKPLGAELPPDEDPLYQRGGAVPGVGRERADVPPGFGGAREGFASSWGFAAEDLVGAAFGGGGEEPAGFEPGLGEVPSDEEIPAYESAPPRASTDEPPVPGDDLIVPLGLSLADAVHGGVQRITVRLPTRQGWKLEELELRVPPGSRQGDELRVAGKGHPGESGGADGDVVVRLQVADDDLLRLEDRDVVLDLPLRPSEAWRGCEVTVPTVHGPRRVRVPAGVKSGQRIRLKGQGLPARDGEPAGHQLLVAQIHLPPHLSDEQVAALEAMEGGFDPRRGWS